MPVVGCPQGIFHRNFGPRVGGERVERIAFPPRATLRTAIDAAARREHEASHAALLSHIGQCNACLFVDSLCYVLEFLPHRVIRNSRKMNDSVDILE